MTAIPRQIVAEIAASKFTSRLIVEAGFDFLIEDLRFHEWVGGVKYGSRTDCLLKKDEDWLNMLDELQAIYDEASAGWLGFQRHIGSESDSQRESELVKCLRDSKARITKLSETNGCDRNFN